MTKFLIPCFFKPTLISFPIKAEVVKVGCSKRVDEPVINLTPLADGIRYFRMVELSCR